MNPPLSVQDSGTDGRGWQNVHAVGAQVALGGAVGGAPVVELCEGEGDYSSSRASEAGVSKSSSLTVRWHHRQCSPVMPL